MIAAAGSGHPGSSLSVADILVMLYVEVLKGVGTDHPDRDRLVLSKGHAAPALYAVLQHIGVLPDGIGGLRALGSTLQGHPDRRFTPGVEVSTGSLGQGMSVALGLAYGLRRRRSPGQVYAILGDGETQEGQVWEAAMAAAHFKLGNLTVVVDANGHQHDGRVDDVMRIEPLAGKWAAFGWCTQEIDGHDHNALRRALPGADPQGDRPRVIVARTTKGRGVDFMEDVTGWHSVADAEALRDYMRRRKAHA
jgi:transketolase